MATGICTNLHEALSEFIGDQPYDITIKYSSKFNPYNASVRKSGKTLKFSLSREWKGVSSEISLGLLQSLASKVLKLNRKTTNIDLYNNFIRSLHISCPKTENDAGLEESFNKVNEKYFSGIMEKPNFAWHSSVRRLASYNYHTDTLSVSDVFREQRDIIDYLIYHELLHKKLKYSSAKSKTIHHSRLFRRMEKQFENAELLEKEIRKVLRK